MAKTRFGNSGVSSLLRTATSVNNKQAAYDDAIQAYIYDLSAKTPEDYQKYQNYLQDRESKSTDPSKALSYQRTITSAYRTFNSSEIARQSLMVNYGDISNTDKYNKMYGLYQQALGNGDYSLAQSIESQLGSLSKTIQNEALAAAGGGGRGGRGGGSGSGYSAVNAKINDLENRVDRAYQTGQPLQVNGQDKYINASDYALNRAQILKAKHDILSAQAQEDPKYNDNLSQLEKSKEWRGLIDSGIVQFDENGQATASDDRIRNLAVSFKKDDYGNTYRTFSAPTMKDGAKQWGLIEPDVGSKKQGFVSDRQLATNITDPSLKGRVLYDVNNFQQNGKDVKGVGSYSDLISGNQVLLDKAGIPMGDGNTANLRAVAYNGKKEQRTPDQALGDLQSLVSSQKNPGGNAAPTAGGLFDLGNSAQLISDAATDTGDFIKKKGALNALGSGALKLAGLARPWEGTVLGSIFKRADFAVKQRAIAEAARQAEARRQAALQAQRAAINQAQAQAASRAAANVRTPSILYSKPIYTPAQQFTLGLPVGKTPTPQQTAHALGDVFGYNQALKKAGF